MVWDPDIYAFHIFGYGVRWYGLWWVIGLMIAYLVVQRLYKRQGLGDEKFDSLFIYAFVGIILGARLGHCLLYDPAYFLSHPLEIVLPAVKVDGHWQFTGFTGLASHGGTLGLMIALWLYVRKTKVNLMRVLDNIAIATPIAAACIRMGNFWNSEIVGKPTTSALGVVFVHNHENFARYPGQLFEAAFYFILFPIGLLLYRQYKDKIATGWFFGWVLTCIFSFRFFIEFLKEVQEPWERTMVSYIGINQGQLLSLPFIILGVYCWAGGKRCRRLGEKPQPAQKA